jgi:hypothetical protein
MLMIRKIRKKNARRTTSPILRQILGQSMKQTRMMSASTMGNQPSRPKLPDRNHWQTMVGTCRRSHLSAARAAELARVQIRVPVAVLEAVEAAEQEAIGTAKAAA